MSRPQLVVLSFAYDAYGGTYQRDVVLDASISETHAVTADVTGHQVESGSNIADNIRPNPRKLQIEGMITNTPLDVPGSQTGGVTSTVAAKQLDAGRGRTVSPIIVQFSGDMDRVRICAGELVDAARHGALFTIVTAFKQYDESFAITNFSVPRSAELGNSLRFTVEFQEIRIVTTQTVEAPSAKLVSKHRSVKTAKVVDPPTAAQQKSAAAALKDATQAIKLYSGGP